MNGTLGEILQVQGLHTLAGKIEILEMSIVTKRTSRAT
jgi:hypothetical protein